MAVEWWSRDGAQATVGHSDGTGTHAYIAVCASPAGGFLWAAQRETTHHYNKDDRVFRPRVGWELGLVAAVAAAEAAGRKIVGDEGSE